jgi:hypothetical protein
LHVVFRTPNLTVLEVPRPTGIVTGPSGARVVRFSQTQLVLRVARRGRYRLAVRYSPYWHISAGCMFGRHDGLSEVVAPRAGTSWSLSTWMPGERCRRSLEGPAEPARPTTKGRPPGGSPR